MKKESSWRMLFYYLLRTFLIGLLGALVFLAIGLPIPWLLGSIFAVLTVQLFTPLTLKWPPLFRDIGLVITGYTIGYEFTLKAIQEMIRYFPMMLAMNLVFFVVFLLISALMIHQTKMDRSTVMNCCLPGGLLQIIAFSEEQKNLDLTAVTFFHVVRILAVVAIVPFIVATEQILPVTDATTEKYSFILFGLLLLCYFVGMLFDKTRVPTGYLLGPVFLITCFHIAGLQVPDLPPLMLQIAQLVLGIYIGLLLQKKHITFSKQQFFYAFFSTGVLIAAALMLGVLMQELNGLHFTTSFLSIVPGGLDQMGIIAASVQADVTVVTAFQLFRILFVSVVMIPFVKWWVRRWEK